MRKTTTATIDRTPRYAPTHVIIAKRMKLFPVTQAIVHPAGLRETDCPIRPEYVALELQTIAGSRWFGCERAYINAELRMVVVGTDTRDASRMKWEVVPEAVR